MTRGTILVVEDEEQVRTLIVRLLTKQGYQVLQAENGRRALEIGRNEIDNITAVITDMVMPEMGGAALLHELRALRADLPAVCMTGYTQEDVLSDGGLRDAVILEKPFTPAVFLDTVARIANPV